MIDLLELDKIKPVVYYRESDKSRCTYKLISGSDKDWLYKVTRYHYRKHIGTTVSVGTMSQIQRWLIDNNYLEKRDAKVLCIIDYKDGIRKVDTRDNHQLQMYAFGALIDSNYMEKQDVKQSN